MKKVLQIGLIFLSVVVFSGCSGKKYFEPEKIDGTYSAKSSTIGSHIVSINKVGATLANGNFITIDGIEKNPLNKNFIFINKVNNTIISADLHGNIGLNEQIIQLDNIVISATLNKNLLAVVYIDNSIGVYDIEQKKTIYKEYLGESLANDTKTTNPIFMSDLILFPSLNGKVIVYNISSSKIIREIIVDASNKQFKNIIFFDIVDEQLIAATANSILSIGANLYAQNYEIKDVTSKDNKIYVATIDGSLIVMDNKLIPAKTQKFKFAKIFGIGFGKESVYAVEYNGYIIKLGMNLNDYKILNISFDNNKNFIITGDRLYSSDKYIELN